MMISSLLLGVLLSTSALSDKAPQAKEAVFIAPAGQLWIYFDDDLDAFSELGDPNDKTQNWEICVQSVRRGLVAGSSPGKSDVLVLQTFSAFDCGSQKSDTVRYNADPPTLSGNGEDVDPFEISLKVISP